MGQIYTVVLNGTLTAAGTDCDLFTLSPADDKPIMLRGIILSQISEVGDAAEEEIRIDIIRLGATVTLGSGGTTPTPQKVKRNSASAGFTVHCNDTTVATTSGTTETIDTIGWNERGSPYERWWPDDRFAADAAQTDALVVRNQTTVADDITIAMTVYVEELP